MDYARNYLNATKIADSIREQASRGKVKRASGLAARKEKIQEAAQESLSIERYLRDIRDMFDVPERERLEYGGMSNRALYSVEGEEIAPEMSLRPAPRWDGPTGISGDIGGREAAEQYLGRKLDDREWEMLARTTYAEATNNPEEQAAIMSVILNRVASDSFGDTVIDVVNQKNQFQAVTGTKDDPGPSERFRAFDEEVLQDFEENVTPRLSNFQEQGWLNFTASNPAAYGPGTNVGFLEELLNAEGAAKIGGTIFGTLR